MKKWICILLVLCLCGCARTEPAATAEATTAAVTETAPTEPSVDLDLTQLSSTILYSKVFHMLTEPEEYLGNHVKVSGPFSVYEDPNSGKRYFAVIITDATACCAQGIEFQLADDPTYPDDYPAIGTIITVTGTFRIYIEGSNPSRLFV